MGTKCKILAMDWSGLAGPGSTLVMPLQGANTELGDRWINRSALHYAAFFGMPDILIMIIHIYLGVRVVLVM